MRNFTLHKFLATLLMAVCSATLSVAQNVAKIGTTEYATLKEAVDAVQTGVKGYIYILNDASFDDLRIEGKQIIINPSLILNIFFHQFLWPLQLLTS